MQSLEREIMEKFNQLDREAQQRLGAWIKEQVEPDFDYDAWFREMEALRQEIKPHLDKDMDVIGLLRDIRDGEDE